MTYYTNTVALTIATCLLLLLPACTPKDKIQSFWQWFNLNKEQFTNTRTNEAPNLDKLLERLHEIEPGLSIEISAKPNEKGLMEITISPEGDIDKFWIVEQIVKKAPAIQGWKPIAFRQPTDFEFTLEYEDLKLSPSELFYRPFVENDSLDIVVYGKGFSQYDRNKLSHYGLIMLDNLMGEYNSVMLVRHYDFQELPKDTTELRRLSGINTFLNDFYRNKK